MARFSEFQVGFELSVTKLDALEEAVTILEQQQPRVRKLELRLRPGGDALLALLGFDGVSEATVAQPQLKRVAEAMSARLVDVENLPVESREAFTARLEEMTLTARGDDDARGTFSAFKQALNGGALLQLQFRDEGELLETWARQIAEGALFIPSDRHALSDRYHLTLVIGSDRIDGVHARVIDRPIPRGRMGFWLELEPSPAVLERLNLAGKRRRQGRALPQPDGVARAAPRYETLLEVRFSNVLQLAAQYASNISRGGMFIHCQPQPELRTRVNLELTLPDGDVVSVPAEVVHRVTTGALAGVGVSFLETHPEALAPVEALLQRYQARKPRVLVVDDEAIWRSTLSRALGHLGCEVRLASDGHEGLLALIDGYFDLDLVVLDLHMPNLDGRGLLERVRRLGGESSMKMVLFSAASHDELQALRDQKLATAVLSKLSPIDELVERLREELGLPAAPPS
jgi:CheY-like chemotaxis protein